MNKKVSNFNKVNLLSFSRIILSFISVLLLLTGDVHFILVSFVIMAISEATDLIDGNVARREGIVTDLGKILDPMSDSISRFLYFFAFAYHGLFPIWFLIIFYLRDIAVAKIRLTSSLSGFVMGARFSGKLKSAVLFIGQYLLLIVLIINSNNFDYQPSTTFLISIVVIGYSIISLLMYFYKIRGWLLYFNLILGLYLSANILIINLFTIKINYLTTFSIAFFMFAISLYALIDYFFALFHKKNNLLILTYSFIVIFLFFLLTPYSIDYFNNSESNVFSNFYNTTTESNSKTNFNSTVWKNIREFENANLDKDRSKTKDKINSNSFFSKILDIDIDFHIYKKNSEIIPILNSFHNNQIELYIYDKDNNKILSEKPYKYLISDKIKSIDKLQFYNGYIYLLDNISKKIFTIKFDDFSRKNIYNFNLKNNNENIQNMDTLKIDKIYKTGYSSNLSFTVTGFNGSQFLLLTNYLYSNTIDFVSIGTNSNFKTNYSLRDQILFNLKAEVYIKDIYETDGKLYIKLVKQGKKEILYKVNLQKYIISKDLNDKQNLDSVIVLPSPDYEHDENKKTILYQLEKTKLYYFNNKIY